MKIYHKKRRKFGKKLQKTWLNCEKNCLLHNFFLLAKPERLDFMIFFKSFFRKKFGVEKCLLHLHNYFYKKCLLINKIQKGMKNSFVFIFFYVLISGILCFTEIRAEVIILTSDQQLYDLMDPDKKIDMSLGRTPSMRSLREVCENGKKHGHKELSIAFDEFFRQYRPHAGTERRLTPDMDEYVDMIKFISDFAGQYGMGVCLSLLSPLELGPAYKNQTGEAGRWLGYKVGMRNPSDGKFSLSIWQQFFWTNNKGKFRINLKNVKAFAFREKPLGG